MAVVGRSGGNTVKYQWRGATVLQKWQTQIQAGMEAEAEEVLSDLRANIHVLTGDMRDKAFAEVKVAGTKRTLVAGSTSDHAAAEELGTIYRSGHPQMRTVFDKHIPHVTQTIAKARKG